MKSMKNTLHFPSFLVGLHEIHEKPMNIAMKNPIFPWNPPSAALIPPLRKPPRVRPSGAAFSDFDLVPSQKGGTKTWKKPAVDAF
jgi:hypothetical protein